MTLFDSVMRDFREKKNMTEILHYTALTKKQVSKIAKTHIVSSFW